MLSRLVAAEDLEAGMWVTIHSVCMPRPAASCDPQRAAMQMAQVVSGPPPGVPLKVLATSLPFVVTTMLKPGGGDSGLIICDMRCHQFAQLNDSYIQAIADHHEDAGDDDEVVIPTPEMIANLIQSTEDDPPAGAC